MERPDETRLEDLVERYGLRAVLEVLAEVCAGKAEHIRADWQDIAFASLWDARASYLEALAAKKVMEY